MNEHNPLNPLGRLLENGKLDVAAAVRFLRVKDPDLYNSVGISTLYRWAQMKKLPMRGKIAFEYLSSRIPTRQRSGKRAMKERYAFVLSELKEIKAATSRMMLTIERLEKLLK